MSGFSIFRNRLNELLLLVIFLIFCYGTGFSQPMASGESGFETIRLSAAGLRTELRIYHDSKGNIFVPLSDLEGSALMNYFGYVSTYLVPMDTIVLGIQGGKDSRFRLREKSAEIDGKNVSLKTAPVLIDGKPFLPMEALEKVWRLKLSYNEETKTYFLDPMITDVAILEIKGKIKLSVKSSGPVKCETCVLENPKRYVLDITGAALAEGIVDRDVHHPDVGSLFISQESFNPNKVRIVIPLEKGIEVEMVDKPVERFAVEAWLFSPRVLAPVTGLSQERITDLRVSDKKDSMIFTVITTGPVQYEWRRLLPPDNRFFIDIPNTLYTAADFAKTFNNGYVDNVRVYQYRPLPDPVVRVAFQLNVPSMVSVGPNPKYPQEIQIEIFAQTINPRRIERQGFGVTQQALTGVIICIDPGHGGGDPGACNSSMGLKEKELTLDICLRLAGMLRKAGWNVVMTRVTDRDVSYAGSEDSRELGDRVNVANGVGANLFVSVHINASTSSSANGTSVHYYKSDSYPLACCILDSLVDANGRRCVGVRNDSFYVIRNTNMPAVLVECAFISNSEEAALLSSPAFRQRCANGIYSGLMAYARTRNFPTRGLQDDDTIKEVQDKKAEVERQIKSSEPVGNTEYKER
jgi:N-acetylmuramoyl-L-alanine amidase